MKVLKPGQVIHGFEVLGVDDLTEFRSKGCWLRHQKTGAQVYKMENPDPENLFSFCFATPPEDSTGVAHILEHTVLCGSKSFPVKDPFLQMLKGSLQTFLNAMTFPDKTIYPASSLVRKDFYNLMEVYGDAVFFPLLKRESFRQEGHRQEFNGAGELTYSGVVFNEMKGNYSSADNIIGDWAVRSLFPTGPYSHDSGGDPAFIPDLTYEDFLKFHQTYYHPSNCLIFLYGCFPLEEQLKFLNRRFLSLFSQGQKAPEISLQPRLNQGVQITKSIPAGGAEGDDQSSVVLSWLTSDILNYRDTLGLDILSEILLSDAGPLLKSILDSGLGEDLSPVSGFENELREGIFSVGLRGMDPKDDQEFEALVLSNLKKYVKEGLDPKVIQGVLLGYEFTLREIKGGGLGLRYLRRILKGWLHGGVPRDSLALDGHLKAIREKLDRGERYFESLIDQYLLQNPHRSRVTFIPDGQMLAQQEDLRKDLLQEMVLVAPAEQLEGIRRDQAALKAFQEAPEDPQGLKSIPKLRRKDIPATVEKIESEETTLAGVACTIHRAFTNQVGYVDLVFPLEHLSIEEFQLSFLFQRCLDSMGTDGLSWDQLAQEIGLQAGGVSVKITVDSPLGGGVPIRRLWVRIKMLAEKIDPALELLGRILFNTNWQDLDRLEDLTLEAKNDFQSALIPRGDHYAQSMALAGFNPALGLSEKFSGISQLDYLNQIIQTQDWSWLANSLTALSKKILQPQGLLINLTGDDNLIPQLKDSVLHRLLNILPEPGTQLDSPPLEIPRSGRRVYLSAPTTVNFTAVAIPGRRFGDPLYEAQGVLAHFLRTGPLWETIRMQGGAYGANASPLLNEGVFLFSSYRDPKLLETLAAFKESLIQCAQDPLDPKSLDQAIIGAVSHELKPRSPEAKAMTFVRRKIHGISQRILQDSRDRLRRLKSKDLQTVAAELLKSYELGSMAVLGAPGFVQKFPEGELDVIRELKL